MILYPPPAQPAAGALLAANNLSDIASAAAARTALEVESARDSYNRRSTRRTLELLLSDGATSKRCVEVTVGNPGNVAGFATTFVGLIPPVSANPSANIFLFYLGPNGSATLGSADDHAWVGFIGTSGQLILSQRGASGAYRLRSLANYVSTYGASWQVLVVSFPTGDSTADPIIWLAGADRFADTTPASSGSVPNWMPTTLQATKWVTGFEWRAGPMPRFTYGPGAWTAAEALVFAQTGLVPNWWSATTGSAVAKYSSDFSAGADSWTAGGGNTIAGNIDSINGQDDWLRVERSSTTGLITFSRNLTTAFSGIGKGNVAIEVRARVYNASATTRYFGAGFSGYNGDPGTTTPATAVAAGAQADIVIRRTLRADEGFTDFRLMSVTQTGGLISGDDTTVPAGDLFYFKNIAVRVLGPVLDLEPDPNFTLRDRKANQLHAIRNAGTSYAGEKVDSIVVAKVSHSGSGNLQFAGGTILDSVKGWVIEALVVRSTAAVTWSFGSASGGAQYVSGYSLAVGDNYIPAASLVTRLIGTANLWSNSNGAADITITAVLRRTY